VEDNNDEIVKRLNTHNRLPAEGRTAVLLIDLEEYFRGLIGPILENLLDVIRAAGENRIPVYFTRHRHVRGQDSGMLGEWWAELIWEGTQEARLLPEIGDIPPAHVIEKDRYSAFHGTSLDKRLQELGITDLVIGGVMTNLCCETTAREAFVRDFRVFFLADGTSTVSRDFHMATLSNLAYGFATLMTCREFCRVAAARSS
jgi:nicotinamidase-related amidase